MTIECRNLTKSFGRTRAVDGISFAADGHVVIIGPSGSGKTTLLRLIAGLEVPDAGSISFDGTPVSEPGWALHPQKRRISCVFQSPALWPHMTVSENIRFGMGDVPAGQARARMDDLMERAGIASLADRYPEARRASIVRALAHPARFILLDEPLQNLNEELKEEMFGLVLGCAEKNGTHLVYITHDMAEAEQIPGMVLSMNRGKLSGPDGGTGRM
ncbi:MAG: ATP-binding cassette domain-containing protein [Methanomicrobiales archaeon]|nr:ATP-binding cassette domain-containing protein [Methanomicrobiales archaeon]